MTSQTINLDLIPKGVQPIVHVSQYDKKQTWLFNILLDGEAYTIPAGTGITIQGTKEDSTGFQYPCTFSGSQVTAIEEQQMTIFAGDVPAELVFVNGNDLIGSINFIIRVEPAALADDTVISETELPLIEEAAELAEHIEEYVAEVQEFSEDAEAYAIGTRDGVPVTSGDPAFENNAKYYADNFVGYVTDSQYTEISNLLQ